MVRLALEQVKLVRTGARSLHWLQTLLLIYLLQKPEPVKNNSKRRLSCKGVRRSHLHALSVELVKISGFLRVKSALVRLCLLLLRETPSELRNLVVDQFDFTY